MQCYPNKVERWREHACDRRLPGGEANANKMLSGPNRTALLLDVCDAGDADNAVDLLQILHDLIELPGVFHADVK